MLQDFGSKNGTLYNGTTVEGGMHLTHGGCIQIGKTEIVVYDSLFNDRMRPIHATFNYPVPEITVVSGQVLKVFKDQPFWPLYVVTNAIKNVAEHPERVIMIAERILRYDANCEAAAFNKAVGLTIKKDETALDAFDHAIAINPTDLWNWLQKGEVSINLQPR